MTCQPIKFFENPPTDIDRAGLSILVEDSVATSTGQSFVDNIRDRDIFSVWNTTGSNDSGNTRLTFTFSGSKTLDHFIFCNHNFKDFDFEYFNGVSWQLAESVTDWAKDYWQYIGALTGSAFRITIYGTQVANKEKTLGRIFFANLIGQLEGYPSIKTTVDFDIEQVKTLSGRSHVVGRDGGYTYALKIKVNESQQDVNILEKLFFNFASTGFFVQVSGGSDEQFSLQMRGYSPNYIIKMKPVKNYKPEFYKGIYQSGAIFDATLTEVI